MLKQQMNEADLKILDVDNKIKYLIDEQLDEFYIFNLKNYRIISNQIFNFNTINNMYEQIYKDLSYIDKCINLKGHILFNKDKNSLIELEKLLKKEIIKCDNSIDLIDKSDKLSNGYIYYVELTKLIYELTLCKEKINECLLKINIILDGHYLNRQRALIYKLVSKLKSTN